jgi:Fic family protein
MRRLTSYIHESADWPRLRWDEARLTPAVGDVRLRQGLLLGRMNAIGFQTREAAVLETLTQDVVKSSDIEGETLDGEQVRSSLARKLGLDAGGAPAVDRHVDGVVEMMLDATRNYRDPLTADRLLGWHASLFPGGPSGMRTVRAGAWRDDRTGPMQVVSGPAGGERVHVEAPPAKQIARHMRAFLRWINGRGPAAVDGVLAAALAHLWFVTIHPFDDGNGRIARAIADLMLARSERSPQRFYSMSAQIRRERDAYYTMLERTQRGTLDVTPWMEWFLACLGRAIDGAETALTRVLRKARFWQQYAGAPFNDRQRLMLNRLLDGFEGNVTTSKWSKIAGCSSDTALRDLTDLVDRGILTRGEAGGRSTSYVLS